MAQPPDDGEQEDQRDWTSLPPELLRLCFSALRWSRTDRTPKRGALASCKGFARAALRASLNALSWDLDEEGRPASSFSRAARLSAQLWGEEEEEAARGRGVALEVFSKRQASPEARCMAALCAANACLPFVTRLQLRVRSPWLEVCQQHLKAACGGGANDACGHGTLLLPQGVALDVLLPAGLGALLPNLRTVLLLSCSLTPAARTTLLDVAAPPLPTQLQELRVDSLLSEDGLDEADEEAATAQLVQLAHLPGLATVQLMYCPTAFLETVGAQLTALHLDEVRCLLWWCAGRHMKLSAARVCHGSQLHDAPTWCVGAASRRSTRSTGTRRAMRTSTTTRLHAPLRRRPPGAPRCSTRRTARGCST